MRGKIARMAPSTTRDFAKRFENQAVRCESWKKNCTRDIEPVLILKEAMDVEVAKIH